MNPNITRGIPLENVTTIACDAYSTLFSKPMLSPQDDVYGHLAGLGFDVNMWGGDKANSKTVWRAYQKYEKLDYRGEIHGSDHWVQMLTDLGLAPEDITGNLMDELDEVELESYRRHVRMFPGAADFISLARRAGLDTILFTSATETGWRFEQQLGLPEMFGGQLVSCFEGVVKRPDASRGETDMETLQGLLITKLHLDPATVLVIDDNKGYLEIAKRLGLMTCLNVQGEAVGNYDPDASYNQHIDVIVQGLLELPQFLPQFAN